MGRTAASKQAAPSAACATGRPRDAFAVIASLLILNSVAVVLCKAKDGTRGLYLCAEYAKSGGRATNGLMTGQRSRVQSCQYLSVFAVPHKLKT